MEKREIRILRELYPGRENFTQEDLAFARKAIEIANRLATRSRIPRTDIRIGDVFEREGVRYLCVRRPSGFQHEACEGCVFRQKNLRCSGLRCSKFDRGDGENVWFIEYGD